MKHHNLDIFPIPKDVLYINEPGMIDESICEERKEPEDEPDNVRIYIPMDLNRTRSCAGLVILFISMVFILKQTRCLSGSKLVKS